MRTVIITGANSGLGYETALKVAAVGTGKQGTAYAPQPTVLQTPDSEPFKVILACRNAQKAEAARARIIAQTGNPNVETLPIDTSSLSSVRAAADRIIASGEKVYALVNNAGISAMGNSGTTPEGFELVFATNYLGHFLLTRLLLPHMADDGRILNISSDMHNPPGGLSWPGAEALAHPASEDRRRYSYSKLCMLYFTYFLSGKLLEEGNGITVNAFNPGFMADTNFSKGGGKLRELAVKTTMPDRYGKLETSSDALSLLVTDPAFGSVSGKYFDRSTSIAPSSDLSYDKSNAAELWSKSLEFVRE